jgi:hypothetical protein
VELDGSGGTVYCRALADGVVPSSVQAIIGANNFASAVDSVANVSIGSLSPATAYSVYCATMSKAGKVSTLDEAITNKAVVVTLCCRPVAIALTSKSVFASSAVSSLATVTVTTLPAAGSTLTARIVGKAGSGGGSTEIFFPANVSFSSTSRKAAALSLLSSSSVGVYNISVKLFGSAAPDYEVVFATSVNQLGIVSASTGEIAAPVLLRAQFSSDGASVTIVFDSATNRASQSSNLFACSLLFTFTWAARAQCQWSSDATSVAVFPSVWHPLSVGSSIYLMPRKLRAACPASVSASTCDGWSYVKNKTVSLLAPSSPSKPQVLLSLPLAIGSCDSLRLDYGSSVGSGGRAWTSINISIVTKASNASYLRSYLATAASAGTSSSLLIPSSYLQKGYLYSFAVALCNFLGACGKGAASVSVLNMTAVPFVSMVGGSTFSITANVSLQLASAAYVAACDGTKSTQDLMYAWTVSLAGNSSAVLSLASISKDPSKYALAAYQLSSQTSYTIQLIVTDASTLQSNSATVTVVVGDSDLVIVIAGGSEQCVRVGSLISVDASGSYDTGQSGRGRIGVGFQWDCYQVSPTYSLDCPMDFNNLTAAMITSTSAVAATAANSSSWLSLVLHDLTKTASGLVVLAVMPLSSPVVSIVSTFSTAQATTVPLVLLGQVETSAMDCNAAWSVDNSNLNLTVASSVLPTRTIAASSTSTTSAVYLSLNANTLPFGATLKFSLACTSLTDSSVAPFASITVLTNRPPTPGTIYVAPDVGQALTTSFTFTATSWVDSDIPLSYEFGFISPVSALTSLVVQSKSLSSYCESLLPAGLSSQNYSLTTTFQIFDNVGAYVVRSLAIVVTASELNSTGVAAVATALVTQSSSSVDGLKQTISVVSSSLNTVNCTLAPNCTSLNRARCSATAQTCGSCLSNSYVGIAGDSNEACVLAGKAIALYAISTSSSCDSDSDCGDWYYCESQRCTVKTKSCSSNCSSSSGGGNCTAQVIATGEVLSSIADCSVLDTNCRAVCECNDGFYGTDCSFTLAEWEAKIETNRVLAQGLQQITSLETLDSQSVMYWANALLSVTSSTRLLSDEASLVARNITETILEESVSNDAVSILACGAALAQTVDNVITALVSSGDSAAAMTLLDLASNAVSHMMVDGQVSPRIVLYNYRWIGSAAATTANETLPIPSTGLESLTSQESPAVSLINPAVGSKTGILSLPKYLSTSLAAGNITSSIFRVNAANFSCGGSSSQQAWEFSFVHYEDQSFGVVNNATNVTRSTACVADGKASTKVVSCPNNVSVAVTCDGESDHTMITTCPKETKAPKCELYFDSDASGIECEVVNYTSITTTCRCDFCAARRRRLAVTLENVGGANVQALSTSSFIEFAAVMESASQFNSLGALQSTVLVIVTFAVMWLGTIFVILAMDYLKRRKRSQILAFSSKKLRSIMPESASSRISMTTKKVAAQATSNLEECLRDYVTELFSFAYSDNADIVRFFRELYYKHKYLSVFATEYGYVQWMGAFALLSNRTSSFFLLAVFYDIQFPGDDGSCGFLSTEASCLGPKSIFNSADSKCDWDASTEMCGWHPPQFDVYSAVVVSIVVLVVSVPIHALLSQMFKRVMLAPSVSDVQRKTASVRTRRASALLMMNAAPAKLPTMVSLTQKKAQAAASVFSMVDNMDSTVQRTTTRAHQLAARTVARRGTQIIKDGTDYTSVDAFVTAIQRHVGSQSTQLTDRRRSAQEFHASAWQPLLTKSADTEMLQAVSVELAAVVKEAKELVVKLKEQPAEQVGVRLLELFARDCLDRKSREATIFSRKINPFRHQLVLTWGIKCVAFSCLLVVNLYFIFACMLYGRDKGLKWQKGWLYTCLVNLFVDICINQVTLAVVIHYWVPNIIVEKARYIRATLTRIVHELCTDASGAMATSFSPASFLFVSAHVAREFPDLLESRIVLANRSMQLSKAQLIRLNPTYRDQQLQQQQSRRLVCGLVRVPQNGWTDWDEWTQLIGLWLTSLLLLFGSQALQVQELIISLFNPALVTVVAFVGIAVTSKSFAGIPIGAIIILCLLCAVGLLVRYYIRKYEEREEDQPPPPPPGSVTGEDDKRDVDVVVITAVAAVQESGPAVRSLPFAMDEDGAFSMTHVQQYLHENKHAMHDFCDDYGHVFGDDDMAGNNLSDFDDDDDDGEDAGSISFDEEDANVCDALPCEGTKPDQPQEDKRR